MAAIMNGMDRNVTEGHRAIVLVNLGSPDSHEVPDVRRYLYQFLMDERVLDVPHWLRWIIVRFFILPFRPKQSAHAYKSIWWDEGSPLIVISQRLREELQKRMTVPVALAMRYGQPSIEQVLLHLSDQQQRPVREVLLCPLYPHYAAATYETVVVEARRVIEKHRLPVAMRVLPPFYNDPVYIEALAESLRPALKEPYDHVLFSYHGLPERQLKKADPTGRHCLKAKNCCQVPSIAHETCYRHQVYVTTHLVVGRLGIPQERYSVAFQSRLGIDRWLQPFTSEVLERLPQQGVKRLVVACPAFVADCLETLEEIGIRGKEAFLRAGGKSFTLAPCLNDHPMWVTALSIWCQMNGYATSGTKDSVETRQAGQKGEQR